QDDPADDRCQGKRDESSGDEHDHDGADRVGGIGDEGHAAGRPGTGKRLTISLTSPARRTWASGSSRRRMASMMIRPTARISSGPNPREVVAGVPIRMPEAVFGGRVSNGIA